MMHIETFTDPSCFQTLAGEWHALLDNSITNQVFITPEFLSAWWKTLGEGKLQIVTFRDAEQKLRGITPFYEFKNDQQQSQLSFLGCTDVSDYLDFIVDKEFQTEVYQEISKYLAGQKDIECAFFFSIPAVSSTLTEFKNELEKAKFKTEVTQQDVCPVITLPATWDEYLSNIGKKQRHEIKRKWEKLFKEQDATFELVELPTETETAISDFIWLHQASSQDKKNFWDDKHVEFFKYFAQKTAEKNWLKLYFLKIGTTRVAAMLGFEYNQQFYLYNSGFVSDHYREYGIGSVLTAYTIQQAIEHKNTRYDFLRGDEAYKFRFRAESEPVFDLKVSL